MAFLVRDFVPYFAHRSRVTLMSLDGMIIFPAAGVFTGLGGVGVSMFFVS